MLKLNTSFTTILPKSLGQSNLRKSVKQSLIFNLSVLPDAVFTGSGDLGNSSRLTLAAVAYCKSLISTLDIVVQRGVEDGFLYDPDEHILFCDSKYRKEGIDYPEGIRLPLELLQMITPCTLLRNDEMSEFADYNSLADQNYFLKKAMDEGDIEKLTNLFKDFAVHYIDPTLKESTEYVLYLAKWFGDAKPSYISGEFAQQVSDILQIQGEIIENMYETAGVQSTGIREKTTEYLESIYRDQDISEVLLTRQFADYLKDKVIRHNDASLRMSPQFSESLRPRAINLLDLKEEWTFESAYSLIKQIIEKSKHISTNIKSTDVGLFAKRTSEGVSFVLNYGENSVTTNAQVAWWCLVLS